MEEEGGDNLYGMIRNNPTNSVDYLGLCCDVKSFSISVEGWNRSWPSLLGRRYGLQLEVEFELELESYSNKSDCRIRQQKRGLVKRSGSTVGSFSSWTTDGPVNWWDGSSWVDDAGSGSWSGNRATFIDRPGWRPQLRESDFPLYWGGVGGSGHFEFSTSIYDWSIPGGVDDKLVREIEWGMLIDYDNPSTGNHYFYL